MSNTQTTSALEPRLRTVWQRLQRKHISAGFLALLRWGIPLFLLGMVVDWLTYMPTTGRFVILLILLSVSIFQAWRHGWKRIRPYSATRAALEIEEQHGDLESLLVTAVQFRESTNLSGNSSSLIEATCNKAEGTAEDIEPANVVNFKKLKKPACIAAGLAALILVFALVNGPFLAVGLARIFTPWTQIAYPTNTILNLHSKDMVVKEGDSAKITIGVSGVIPDNAKFYLRTGEGKPHEIELPISNGTCEYTLASASRDFSYRIKAGDARSDWHQVHVIAAPRIDEVQVKLEYPSYLERKTETVEALTLTVPQGTKLLWEITLDQPVREAKLHRDGKDPLPLKVINSGRQVVIEEEVKASRGYSFSWVEDNHGFDFTSPRYYLQVATDQAPRVELTSPESNLLAMIGRPLKLAARIQDDHGIGETSVVYRVNQRDEKSVPLNISKDNQGEQTINWDYRNAISDLKVGDTIFFTIETKDKYPGPNGPHVVRSDTRHIKFLSKKAYLAEIQKKRDRLLTRMLTIYRQQRSAFDTVRSLNPDAESYMQTCQVEAIRQELVREQLKEIASQVKVLIDDLAANNVSDAPEGESLEHIRLSLVDIAEKHLADAASKLRHQSGVAAGRSQEKPDPSSAARAVNTAARELGSLVLLRSIDMAQEVYAREARMLAQVQANLRWRSVQPTSPEQKTKLSKEQEELAQWTKRLTTDLQQGMRYERRPLAVLRLGQSIKGLKAAKIENQMRQAAAFIKDGKADQAEQLQAKLITTLLDAEFSVRLSGAYTTLIKTRDQMRLLVKAQAMLRNQCTSMSDEKFKTDGAQAAQSQNKLRKQLLTLLLPTVPAPRADLFDETFPTAPPVQSLLKNADNAMAEALTHFSSGQKDAAISQQHKAEQALTHLVELVDRWSVEMGLQTLGLGTLVASSAERLARIEEFEANIVSLLEKTDATAAEEKNINILAKDQELLAKEISAFKNDLLKQHEKNQDKDIPPLLSRMKRAEQAAQNAFTAMKANDADQALTQQEQAADILAEAFTLVTRQNEQLGLLQSLLMFQRSVSFANGYMGDIVAEQWDLIAATKALKDDDASAILPMFAHLRRCMDEVAPLLDLVAKRVDAGTPLAFSISDLEDAVDSLENEDKIDAIDAQDVAAESLAKVHTLVKDVKAQTGYIAEIVAFLHNAVADTATLEYQQAELMRKTQTAKPDQLKALTEEQANLLAKAEKNGQLIKSVTGGIPAYSKFVKRAKDKHRGNGELVLPEEMPAYTEPANSMREAVNQLTASDIPTAAEHMELASLALQKNTESLFTVISMLQGLPDIDVDFKAHTEPGIRQLVDVLVLASAHKVLFRDTNATKKEQLKDLAKQQSKLAEQCQKLSQDGEPHPMLQTASSALTQAASAMQSNDENAVKTKQKEALQALRHFIIEKALIYDTATPPAAPSPGDPDDGGEGSDSESAFAAGFISDFVSGEAPKEQRSEWKVRGERNRAALNQNFARELPLEYRGLLKNYYERVAK